MSESVNNNCNENGHYLGSAVKHLGVDGFTPLIHTRSHDYSIEGGWMWMHYYKHCPDCGAELNPDKADKVCEVLGKTLTGNEAPGRYYQMPLDV